MKYLLCILLSISIISASHSNSDIVVDCKSTTLSKDSIFEVTAYIEGVRGTLRFPAIIDTGATHTFIPRSIADGIGYEKERSETFTTAAGEKTFKVITAKKLTFLGAEFDEVEVAITEPKLSNSYEQISLYMSVYNDGSHLNKPSKKENELALIGMSELSRTSFTYENKELVICSEKN